MNGRRPIIEIVGIAGAGKTTPRQILQQRHPRLQFRVPPPKVAYLSFLGEHLFKWLLIHLSQNCDDRWFTWEEIRNMGYLEIWIPHLQKQALKKQIISILDPGSVYWLAVVREFGPKLAASKQYTNWWNEKLHQWRQALGLIVWLDAPLELLLHRVQNREEWHEAKGQTPEAVLEDFSRLKKRYDEIVHLMTREGGPQLLHFPPINSLPSR
jgi:hypothetical protein